MNQGEHTVESDGAFNPGLQWLPPESLIPFQAHRLVRASCVFVNRCNPEHAAEWLENYAYLVPQERASAEHVLSQQRVFFAERYGGAGVGWNGGGARCGLHGDYQVKGIGRNPLAGPAYGESGFWHSHGGLTLAEALQEAVWGEVFAHALPGGAVRVAAVISTGTQCWARTDDGRRVTVPAALVVRRAALRPAHFERAPYFRAQEGVPLTSDVNRVRSAIQVLPDVLPLPPGASGAHGSSRSERLREGLMEMARRFAIQSAASKARRLMHGALCSSNVCLDGSWLDFGTASALPSHANTKVFDVPPQLPTFWEEHTPLVPVLTELAFYVRKYFKATGTADLPRPSDLPPVFELHYSRALYHAFLRLTGVPEPLLVRHRANQDIQVLAATLIETARFRVKNAFVPGVPDLEVFGGNTLGSVLLILARWGDHPECAARLAGVLDDESLRGELIRAYRAVTALVDSELQGMGLSSQGLRRLRLLEAARSARTIRDLYRHRMVEGSRELASCATGAELHDVAQRWIDDLSDAAATLYADAGPFRCLSWKSGRTSVWYDAIHDAWCLESGSAPAQFLPLEAVGCRDVLAGMQDFWDPVFLNEFLAVGAEATRRGVRHG